jgi:hypothetical protein
VNNQKSPLFVKVGIFDSWKLVDPAQHPKEERKPGKGTEVYLQNQRANAR